MEFYEQFVNGYSKLGGRVSDLSRISALLEAIGDPQDKLRFIHVAGTNGKGSCAQMLSDMLVSAGYKAGLFTSPYIFRYNDRIRINNADISDDELNETARRIAPHAKRLGSMGFSQFEITQAIAFDYFAASKCDVVVLETGLGGALDSTNVIAPPLLSLICSVSYDHTAILGETIEEIAEQKAGIIKRGSPVVLAPGNPPQAVDVVRRRAQECGSRLVIPDISTLRIAECGAFGTRFSYKGEKYSTAMGGYHQVKNALSVIECAGLLKDKFDISREDIQKGLSAQVAGRIQLLSREPLIILDGGHNPEALEALANSLDLLDCRKRVVIGMLSDKDSAAAAKRLARSADSFICVDGFYPNSRDKNELAEILRSNGAIADISELSAEETVIRETAALPQDEALVICGSLFLASLFADGKITSQAVAHKLSGSWQNI